MTTEVATTESLRDLFKRQVSEAAVEIFPEYLTALRESQDPDEMRKFLALATEVNGWKDVPQKNPLDNLPVFNFTFAPGSVTVTTTAADGTTQSMEVSHDPALMPAAEVVEAEPAVEVRPVVIEPIRLDAPSQSSGTEMLLNGDVIDLDQLLAEDD